MPRRSTTCARTGRTKDEVELVERYCKEQGLFRTDADARADVHQDGLARSCAPSSRRWPGPKRPQDRVPLAAMKETWHKALTAPVAERGFGLDDAAAGARRRPSRTTATRPKSRHGAVVIAAITSCTNTSNPSVMLAAGLLAKKAVEQGPARCRRT